MSGGAASGPPIATGSPPIVPTSTSAGVSIDASPSSRTGSPPSPLGDSDASGLSTDDTDRSTDDDVDKVIDNKPIEDPQEWLDNEVLTMAENVSNAMSKLDKLPKLLLANEKLTGSTKELYETLNRQASAWERHVDRMMDACCLPGSIVALSENDGYYEAKYYALMSDESPAGDKNKDAEQGRFSFLLCITTMDDEDLSRIFTDAGAFIMRKSFYDNNKESDGELSLRPALWMYKLWVSAGAKIHRLQQVVDRQTYRATDEDGCMFVVTRQMLLGDVPDTKDSEAGIKGVFELDPEHPGNVYCERETPKYETGAVITESNSENNPAAVSEMERLIAKWTPKPLPKETLTDDDKQKILEQYEDQFAVARPRKHRLLRGPHAIVHAKLANTDDSDHRSFEVVHWTADPSVLLQKEKGEFRKTTEILSQHELQKGCGWSAALINALVCNGGAEMGIEKQHFLSEKALHKVSQTSVKGLLSVMVPGRVDEYFATPEDLAPQLEPWYVDLLNKLPAESTIHYHNVPNGKRRKLRRLPPKLITTNRVPFQKDADDHFCHEAAMCNGIALKYGKDIAEKMMEQMKQLRDNPDSMKEIYKNPAKGNGDHWHKLNDIITRGLGRDEKHRKFDVNSFRPQDPGACTPIPIVAQISHNYSSNYNHMCVFWQDMVCDSELEFALKLCKETLDWLGGEGAKFTQLLQVRQLSIAAPKANKAAGRKRRRSKGQ